MQGIFALETASSTPSENSPPSFASDAARSHQLLLGGISNLNGSLTFSDLAFEDGSDLGISAPNITYISGDLTFRNIQNLKAVRFESLDQSDSIIFEDVTFSNQGTTLGTHQFPQLTSIANFKLMNTNAVGVVSLPYSQVDISKASAASIYAMQNKELRNIDLNGYGGLSFAVDIDINDNNDDLRVTFKDITNASLRISNVASFEAPLMAALWQSPENPSDPLSISNNSFRILDLSALQNVQGYLQIADNFNLDDLSTTNLHSVTGLEINGNLNLHDLNFPNLDSVNDLMNVTGTINSLPAEDLEGFEGTVNVTSDGTLDCQPLKQLQGDVNCNNNVENLPGASSSTSPAGGSSSGVPDDASGSGGLSTGAKAGIGVGVGIGGLLLIAGVIFLFYRSRKRRSSRTPRSAAVGEYSKSQQSGHGDEGRSVSPIGYSKVPYHESSPTEDMQEQQSDRRPPSSLIGDEWSPPEQDVPSPDGRVELEEQQGQRHEMDARSLPDMDMDDEEEETRSLRDIEMAHERR